MRTVRALLVRTVSWINWGQSARDLSDELNGHLESHIDDNIRAGLTPGFAAAAVVTLALGIGANTAIFSIVNAVVLRPLPFKDSSRIMRVWHTPPPTFATAPNGRRIFAVSAANFLDWQTQNHVFEKMALYRGGRFNLTGRGEPA